MESSAKIQQLEERVDSIYNSSDSNVRNLRVSEGTYIKNKRGRVGNLPPEEIYKIIQNTKRDILNSVDKKTADIFDFVKIKQFKAKDALDKINSPSNTKGSDIQSLEENETELNSRVKFETDEDDPKQEPLKINVEEDSSSIVKIADNNEKIYERLREMGEVDMANHIHELMANIQKGPEQKYVSEITDNTNQLKNISDVNIKIEQDLNEIKMSLRQGQDTEIESIEETLVQKQTEEETEEQDAPRDESSPFWETMLSMLIGKPLMMLLTGAKSIMGLATGILTPAIGWLLKTMSAGITKLFNGLMKGPLAAFNFLRDKFNNFLNVTFNTFKNRYDKFKSGFNTFKSSISTKLENTRKMMSKAVNVLNTKISDMGKYVKNILSKIPGIGKLGEFASKSKEKISSVASTVKVGAGKATSWLGGVVDKTKSVVKTGAKTVYKSGKGAVDWQVGKYKQLGAGITSVARKVGSRFSNIPAKLTNHVNKTGGKIAKPSLFGKLGKFSKVLRAVPFLGQAIAVGFAAKAGYSGWNNAGALYGVPQKDTTASAKGASAVGAIAKDLLWPLPISQSMIANAALSLTGSKITKTGDKVKGNYSSTLGDIDQFNETNSAISEMEHTEFDSVDTPFKNISGFDSSIYESAEYSDIQRYGMPIPSKSVPSFKSANYPINDDFKSFDKDTHPIPTSAKNTTDSGLMGFVSAKYESAGKGVHTISTGRGDPGGVSYGAYQLASKTGTMQAFLNSSEGSKFKARFAGATPGSKGFSSVYAEIASQDPVNFNEAQHLFIKRTHYDPVASMASGMGISTSRRSIQEALWSQSVQHGRSGNKKILQGALAIADPRNIPDFLRAVYTSRSNYVSGLGINSGTKSSILNRYSSELNDVLGIEGSGGSSTIVDTPSKAVSTDSYSVSLQTSDISGSIARSNPVGQSIKTPEDSQEHDPAQDVGSGVLKSETPVNVGSADLESMKQYITLYSPFNPDFDGLRPETKARFLAMAKEHFENTGEKIQINSAFRSMEKQAELYKNRDKNPNPVAKPGGSIHNYGMALDIQSAQVNSLRSSGLLAKYGFGEPVRNDPPHIEDITVNRDKIRQDGYSPSVDFAKNSPAQPPSSGSPYDGEASDYKDDNLNILKELGFDMDQITSEFTKVSQEQMSGNKQDDSQINSRTVKPENNKIKSQSEIESTMIETQEISNLIEQNASSNIEIMNYIDSSIERVQEQINQVTVTTQVNSSSDTSDVFAINNEEYTPGQELRF